MDISIPKSNRFGLIFFQKFLHMNGLIKICLNFHDESPFLAYLLTKEHSIRSHY